MAFKYIWKHNEANFGAPIEKQLKGGAHISFEIILKAGEHYIALRRPKGIPEHELPPRAEKFPKGLLYFCHNLIRYGESVEECVKRIVKDQAGVGITNFKIVSIDSLVQEKDNNWAFMPYVVCGVSEIPQTNPEVTEVVLFERNNILDDFAWWTQKELEEFLEKYD